MAFQTLIYIFILGWMWGPSFLFIKIAGYEIPPFTAATLRVGIASLVLLTILKWKRAKLPPIGPIWGHFAVMGIISMALTFMLFFYGESYIDSSLAALINGSPPIYTAILAHFFLKDEPINFRKCCGVILGLSGLLALFLPNVMAGAEFHVWGTLAIMLATFFYAVGFVYAKRFLIGLPPLVAPTSQLICATLFLLPFSLIIDRPYELVMPSLKAWGSVCFLGVFGTAIAFILYYKVLELAGAMALSMTSYLLPVIGMLLGVLILDEPIAWNSCIGGLLILSAMVLVNTASGAVKVPKKVA